MENKNIYPWRLSCDPIGKTIDYFTINYFNKKLSEKITEDGRIALEEVMKLYRSAPLSDLKLYSEFHENKTKRIISDIDPYGEENWDN